MPYTIKPIKMLTVSASKLAHDLPENHEWTMFFTENITIPINIAQIKILTSGRTEFLSPVAPFFLIASNIRNIQETNEQKTVDAASPT
jgi:hypothetical protein